jgi:hypothetical protein
MKKKDTTESELIAQIRRSLENYEEPYVPGSWEGFLQKRGNQRRRFLVRMASGIAACLLLGLIGVNYFQSVDRDLSGIAVEKSTVIANEKPLTAQSSIQEAPAVVAATNSAFKPNNATAPVAVKVAKSEQKLQTIHKETPENSVANLAAAKDSVSKTTTFVAGTEKQTAKVVDDSTKSKPDSTSSAKTAETYLAIQSVEANNKVADDPKRKVRFGVNFSPGLNSSQSASSVNYTGGVSADIPLSSHFQLSTGLQVENQNLVKEFPSIAASSTAPRNEIKRELINLDLPLNLTWKFVAEKSHAYYVSAGVSSLVHLRQEDRNTTYSQDLIPVTSLVNGESVKSYNVVDMVSVTQNTVAPTQTFDFAGRINLMVGFEKKLTNRFYLHIEPYTKIPTSTQSGSFNYTTSGINFKVSF